MKVALGLNSANSINISRLLAQICYYFEAVAQLPQEARNQLVVSVPSGNFGDLTAGLLAKSLGLPVKRFIAATNVNDTVPRFLHGGQMTDTEPVNIDGMFEPAERLPHDPMNIKAAPVFSQDFFDATRLATGVPTKRARF